MAKKQSNFSRLEAAGLIVKGYKFTEEDKKAIESLSVGEVDTVLRVVRKLAPDFPKEPASLRGIIL